MFSKKIFSSKIFLKKTHQKYFQKKSPKIFPKEYFCQIFFQKKKVGAKAPLLPAGPRLISSDSEISA